MFDGHGIQTPLNCFQIFIKSIRYLVCDERKSFLKDLRTIKSQMAPSCGISYSKAAISWGNIENRSLSLHCKRHFIANSLAVCIEANSSVRSRSATKLEIKGHIVKRPKIFLGNTTTENTRENIC